MRLWLCILDGCNHNFLLQSSVSQQSWLLLHLLCQVCAFYGLVKQYLFFLATIGIFLLLLFKELYEYTVFSTPKWWKFFAFVWFPKIYSLWSLTRSFLRTPFNCRRLCFHFAFASWYPLHLCTVCSSHLLDHPSYSASQWGFHTSTLMLPEEFWCCHRVFAENLLGYQQSCRVIKVRQTLNLFSFQRATDTIITSIWKIMNVSHRHTFLSRPHLRIVPLVLEGGSGTSGKIWCVRVLKSLVSSGRSQAHLVLGAGVALLLMPSVF